MRQILFSMFFAGMANVAVAQHFSLSVNGGGSYSTPVHSLDKQTEIFWDLAEPSYSSFVSIKGMFEKNKWQYGLSIGLMQAKYRSHTEMVFETYMPDPFAPLPTSPRYISLSNANLFPVRAFVNRKIVLNKLNLYGGLASSYIITPDRDARPWFGYGAGVQCGILYPISKQISMNMEVTGDKMWFRQQADCLLTMYNTTASLGLTYRLN